MNADEKGKGPVRQVDPTFDVTRNELMFEQGDSARLVHGDGPIDSTATLNPAGEGEYSLHGAPPRNEQGVRRVCVTLAGCMTQRDKVQWEADQQPPSGPELGIDWFVRSEFRSYPVQVTRVTPSEAWARLGAQGQFEREVSVKDVADDIWKSVERKLTRQDPQIILALDARHPGIHGFRDVITHFISQYGDRLRSEDRFAEVWVIGLSEQLSYQVYPDSKPTPSV